LSLIALKNRILTRAALVTNLPFNDGPYVSATSNIHFEGIRRVADWLGGQLLYGNDRTKHYRAGSSAQLGTEANKKGTIGSIVPFAVLLCCQLALLFFFLLSGRAALRLEVSHPISAATRAP
jgi:hypothetical protein